MNNERAKWNRRKGRLVRYHTTHSGWDGRIGICKGCTRGDRSKNDPWVTVYFTHKADGSPMQGTLWHCPASFLEVVNPKIQ